MVEGTIFGHLADALKAGYPVDYKRGVSKFWGEVGWKGEHCCFHGHLSMPLHTFSFSIFSYGNIYFVQEARCLSEVISLVF